MKWFNEVVPPEFLGLADGGLYLIGGVFFVLLAVVVVLTVRALKRNDKTEDDDASQ